MTGSMDTSTPLDSSEGIAFPTAPRRSIPPTLAARYEDITLVGEGGMGTVYRGRDPRLGRSVALKLIKGDDPALWQRFLQEAKAQARIQHAYVCRVYEAGQADGEPYIAMQYVDGQPLSQIEGSLSLEQNVKLIAEVAAAVHEAHRLGLIHRDIKPGNILVEPQEDGTLKPYIMDFGLARQIQAQGQTATGALVGTLAYMSPEQANGDVRSMDRRSDVYSLGATLYEAIAGRPPFVAENHWQLLLKIGDGEAPALGRIKKGVPVDLETIVMKCLEREPSRRYDSAKALAEDLQRFLDGDAILAKRSSLGYVLWKKAKKHKIAVAFGIVAIFAAAVPLGAWIQSRRQMAVQVELSRRLGEDVKSNELYLRAVYELPLHDVNKERDVIRKRLEEIEKNIPDLGKAGEGPGHYAIGRGQMALGDMKQARMHLEQALATGYAPPELHYALGRVLGELYRQGLEESKRLTENDRKTRVLELETQLRDPAIEHLRAATTGVESPAYVEGLLAFYEGKYDEALEKARKAFADAPLMYEAKKLEGDIFFVQGNEYRPDAAFDYEKMASYYNPAAEAYAVAANVGRSDPDVHRAACELGTFRAMAEIDAGNNPTDSFEKADASCLRAIEVLSTDPRARIQRAFCHAMFSFEYVQGNASGVDVPAFLQKSIRIAEEARNLAPTEAFAHYVVGVSFGSDARYLMSRARDASSSIAEALKAFEHAQHLDPRFVWAFQDGTSFLIRKLQQDGWKGLDPKANVVEGAKLIDAATALDPSAPYVLNSKGILYGEAARVLNEQGQSPETYIREALLAHEEFKRRSPNHWLGGNNVAATAIVGAIHSLTTRSDTKPLLEKAHKALDEAKARASGVGVVANTEGELGLVEAQYVFQQNGDPSSMISIARDVYASAAKESPWDVMVATQRTRVEIVALRWAMKKHEATQEMFNAAFAPLSPLFSDEIADPSVHVTLAHVHALHAQWLVEAKKDPTADIENGISLTNKALLINPRRGQALALQGELLLMKAQIAEDPSAKRKAAIDAKEMFARAFKEMPILEKEYATSAKDAAKLAQ